MLQALAVDLVQKDAGGYGDVQAVNVAAGRNRGDYVALLFKKA